MNVGEVREQNEPVASNIHKIIIERCLKQCSIAQKAGYTPNMFNSMIKGRRLIKVADVVRIAEALGVNESDLFRKEE